MSAVSWAGAAWAADPVVVTTLSAEQQEAERFFVRWLSAYEERAAVRSAARSALLTGETAEEKIAAVTEFLDIGYTAAMERAQATLDRQTTYARRMVATHPARTYPRVNAAGQRALAGSEVELDEFARTGYVVALELDRKGIADDKLRADLVKQDDRNFVAFLRDNDPGAQVQAWARRVVTDDDVAEFLNYGWASAAALDTQTYRRQCADADKAWLLKSRELVAAAQTAEQKALGAAGEAKEQLRAAAARDWADVAAHTSKPRVAWAEAEQVALQQAETWLQISIQAAGTTSPNWQNIAGTAQGTRDQWLTAQQTAAEQAASWAVLYQRALAAEAALLTPTSLV
ncbi:hypothetical protein [Actinoplanes sichuanensis]|uniref:Uncharacterized protein n=1 Tax=Actinoplanes sichuanensis TaxID=512349 RepID=A0ABW4AGG7_9ACTN|nr:hypothetical protein [Actinoplanes sichuanensis]